MKVKYKCAVELEWSPEIPEYVAPEKIEQLIDEYKKRVNDNLDEEMENAIRDEVVGENADVHVERVYLTFE